jgi:hypothetical protein
MLLTGILFLPLVLQGEFIWDDTKLVELNLWTGSFGNLGLMFTSDLWASTPLGAGDFFYYRPLMLVDLTVDRSLGLGASGHHLHSLFWHLSCVALLYRLCSKESSKTLPLLAAVSLFALHPLQVETVAHIAARNDAMACSGILGALLLLRDPDPETKVLWAASACVALAVFSKETALLAPLVLWVFDRAYFGGAKNPRRYAAVLLPVGLALGLRLSLGGAGLPIPRGEDLFADLLGGTGFYLGALVFPWGLTPAVSTSEMSLALLPMLLGLGALFWLYRATSPLGRAGLGLALLGFLPALPGLLLTENTGFRYLYLPLAGLSIALHGALQNAPRGGLILLPAVLFGLSAKQMPHWKNDAAFWGNAYAQAPGLQSACGMFKAVEAEALGLDPGPDREARFLEAEPWLAKSLEPPTNAYCCLSASRWMWDRNQQEWDLMKPQPAIEWGRLALANGCEKSPEILVPLAVSEALVGQWELAENRIRGLKRSPYGLRQVLLSASALRRGDSSVLASFSQGDAQAEEALQRSVHMLLDASLAVQGP